MTWELKEFDVVLSTNETACDYPPFTVVIAGRQLKGRGRMGRVWQSPLGNLYASFVFPKTQTPPAFLSFLLGVSVVQTLHKPVALKWPNDILLNGKKCGGILLEQEDDKIIAGLGLNLSSCPKSGVMYPVTHLGYRGTPALFTKRLLKSIEKNYELLETKGFPYLREIWLSHAYGLKGPVKAVLPNKELTGIFYDLTPNGELVLITPDNKKHLISCGDIFFKKP